MNVLKCIAVFQTAEEVSFAANGITAAGIKAFDGVLQSNVILKALNLSGNPIGDEGVKVSPCHVTDILRNNSLSFLKIESKMISDLRMFS